MSALSLFQFDETRELRVQTVDGEPWFAVADVCKVLGLTNASKAAQHVDPEDKTPITIGYTPLLFVSEPGLYEIVIRSNMPTAKAFRKWVFKEVIPSIRKTGQYSTNSAAIESAKIQLRTIELTMQHFQSDAHLMHLVKGCLANTLSGGGEGVEELKDLTEIMLEMGIDIGSIQNQRAAIGKHVAKRYRETRGVSPGKVSKYVAGAHRPVNAYLPSDYEDIRGWVDEAMGV